jgi:TPR repeat protein
MLPGQVRKLGSKLTYMTARRPIKTTGVDCEIRGGEYVAFDRATYAGSLKIWLPLAEGGDPKAQTYVGEIFEKGLGQTPDYASAQQWYRRAADQGYAPAQINLGQLYELGRGVPKDSQIALDWYRKASGLSDLDRQFVTFKGDAQQYQQLRNELNRSSAESKGLRAQVASLNRDLGKARKKRQQAEQQIDSVNEELISQRKDLQAKSAKLAADEKSLRAQRAELANKTNAKPQSTPRAKPDPALIAREKQIEKREAELEKLAAKLKGDQQQLDRRLREARQIEKGDMEIAAQRKELDAKAAELTAASKRLDKERAELARKQSETPAAPAGPDPSLIAREKEIQKRDAELKKLAAKLKGDQQAIAKRESSTKQAEGLAAELAAQRKELDAKASELAAESKRLASERTELASQKKAAAQPDPATIAREKDLQKKEAELQKLAANLEREKKTAESRVGEIETREKELAALDADIKNLAAEAEKKRVAYQKEVESKVARIVEGPTILLIDPSLPLTRSTDAGGVMVQTKERTIVGRVDAPAGLVSLLINDVEAKVDKEGFFESEIRVRPVGTPVEIRAIDGQGKRATRRFTLRRGGPGGEMAASGPVRVRTADAGIDFGRYYALVIGNSKYRHMPNLDTARADATTVSQLLRSKYGFEVKTLLDANRYQILAALNEMRGKLKKSDNFVLYYAGHGDFDAKGDSGYWLPVDARPEDDVNWISNRAITDILNAADARHVLVVADSCYSGSLTETSIPRVAPETNAQKRANWLAKIMKKSSRTALTSGGLAPVLDGGGGKHSIFARALIEILRKNDDVLDGSRLHTELAARVRYKARSRSFQQDPEYAPIRYGHHGGGEFFFVPKG